MRSATSPRHGAAVARSESLEAPVQYAKFESGDLVDDDEETKESDEPTTAGGAKDRQPMHLRGVVDDTTTSSPQRGCLKTKRGKVILTLSVLGLVGLVAALAVTFGNGTNGGTTASAAQPGGGSSSDSASSTSDANGAKPIVSTTPAPLYPPTTQATPPPPPTTTLPPVTPSPMTSPPVTSPPVTLPPPTTTLAPVTTKATSPPTTTTTPIPTPAPTPSPLYGRILDGTSGLPASEVTNPTSYPDRGCRQPTYLSQKGQILAQAPDGSTTPIAIKGINWFGMDTEKNIPFGLWANPQNGTSLHEVVAFLARHNFNSIRLPLTVDSLVKNTPPDLNLVNVYQSPTLNVTSYTAAVSAIVQALAYRNISVLLDIHYLSADDKGDAWFSANYPESATLRAVDVLTSSFCNDAHWNVIGIDLKNEPWNTTWGDNGPKDMRVGAATLGNRMLQACSQWLVFVEGNARSHTIQLKGQTFDYYDWWGGGLQNAGKFPLSLNVPNKIVWAPHYYNPSVYPQTFLVKNGHPKVPGGDVLTGYTEWGDADLLDIVNTTAEGMFGYLRQVQGGAIVFGEFGGIFSLDAHPGKTSQRVVKSVMQVMQQPGYAGGYMWALNPEGAYSYNPSDTAGYWEEGLLTRDWVNVNLVYLKALEAIDTMPNLKPFPCFT
ncbi:Aste57867_16386 [Aphanomyces stellatus]|uniref:Aste57867_16386 protein n=1 Tax=Aphanomyces stellatus TaxID=120398 RepID=A0A485L6A6_9STRA|nr:hypothetical protein As57867_016329 [Aphanomyces stellatus]VFT93162.1 Aste57867_16386 [Aphanomyces stellatus]